MQFKFSVSYFLVILCVLVLMNTYPLLVSEDLVSGEILNGDITQETRQTLLNMKQILEANGSDMGHVVRCEVLLHDFAERNEMNEEYMKHFPADAMPARLCYGGVDLAAGCKIEIIAIARKIED